MSEEEVNAAEDQEVEQQEEQQEQQQEESSGDSSEAGRVAQAVRQDYQGKLDEEKRARQAVELENLQLRQQAQVKEQPPLEDDGEDLMTKAEFKEATYAWQKEASEQTWMSSNQDQVKEIEAYLPDILKQKPWLADVIKKAPNRYQVAAEVVSMNKPKEEAVAKRIVENASKPGNPSAVGKSAKLSNLDKLQSMSTKEFKEYRRKLLNRR